MRNRLKELRKNKQLTQGGVAKEINISRSFYGLIELGVRNPGLDLAYKIANYFNVTVEELFFDEECNETKQPPEVKVS